MTDSPYRSLPVSKWLQKTKQLIAVHPLAARDIEDLVLRSWDDIFISRLGANKWRIGKDIFPKPQVVGFLLHEFMALRLATMHPGKWRGDETATEKDFVCITNPQFSIEVKTSSNPRHIFGNRSYAQKASVAKKDKSGYYLAVNFQRVLRIARQRPEITWVRFGWLDSSDWRGQAAETGQQCRLAENVAANKLIDIYRKTKS